MSPSPRCALRLGACVLALGLGACSSKPASKDSAAPPTMAPAAGGDAEWPRVEKGAEAEASPAAPNAVEELQALDALLDAEWAELQALDDARAKEATPAGATHPGAAERCQRIRGLATEICALSDRMCMLATKHPGQVRYTDACARAGQTCARAREAAERCPAA